MLNVEVRGIEMNRLENLKIKPDTFKVSGDRAFYTLQGEGVSTGEPSVFLRLHFCNLSCGWCDTPYTWNKEMAEYYSEPGDWTIEETAKNIEGLWGCENPSRVKRVIITGGEPLIQKNNIDKLIDLIPEWEIEIETNGTVMPTEKQLRNCRFNCSPKLSNSGDPKVARIKEDVIRKLIKADTTFKFVVMNPEDLEEIERDFVLPFNIPVDQVILMPEGTNVEALRIHSQAVAEVAKKKGYRLLGRLQVNLWGLQRRT